MISSASVKTCIDLCLGSGVDFALAILPDETTPRLFIPALAQASEIGGDPTEVFELGLWLAPYSNRISINGRTDLTRAIMELPKFPLQERHAPDTFPLPRISTTRQEYMERVEKVIENCRRRDGKTVFSRVICGSGHTRSWGAIFNALSETFPSTFRFIFHTSDTGGWMGATPETLLNVDFTTGRFHTMAFAGTRLTATPGTPWDKKNLRENEFVSTFIAEKIKAAGVFATAGKPRSVAYGSTIEHLCRDFEGILPANRYAELLDALNPTPALCGTPRENAIEDIASFETHKRGCYGGFVALKNNSILRAFVALRCCAFSGPDFAIYAGGGITSESIAEKEWKETEAKSLFFQKYLLKT